MPEENNGTDLPVKYDPERELGKLITRCLEAKGFVVFTAELTNEKDKDGNLMLRFNYSRHHYPFEDLKKAIDAFKAHCERDMLSTIRNG